MKQVYSFQSNYKRTNPIELDWHKDSCTDNKLINVCRIHKPPHYDFELNQPVTSEN